MLVSDWMSRELCTIPDSEPIPRAIARMRERRIRRLPVVRGEILVGIVTDRDLREYMPSKATDLETHELRYLVEKTPVGSVMTQQVITVSPDTPLEQAATLMRRFKIGGLPVLQGPALVGVITESDIFDALVELLGAPEPGGRIELELGASATALRDVLDVVKEFSPTVVSALTYSRKELPQSRCLLLKVKIPRTGFDSLVNRLEDTGISVTDSRYAGGSSG